MKERWKVKLEDAEFTARLYRIAFSIATATDTRETVADILERARVQAHGEAQSET